METKLKHLKEEMNRTVFENISFSEELQHNVLRTVKKSSRKGSIFKERFYVVLSLAVTSCLFIGMAYFVGIKTHILNGGQRSQGSVATGRLQGTQVNETIYTPPKQAENYQIMTKEEILTKMINTVDYFETARGEFKIHDSMSPGYQLVDYELSLHHQTGGYSRVTTIGTGKERTYYNYYRDGSKFGTSWYLNEQLGVYTETKYQIQPRRNLLTIQEAFKIDKEGNNVTDYRERPLAGAVAESLFNYEIASNYTRNLNTWQIEKQNEMLLGHNTVVIKGLLNNYAKLKNKADSFRFWVDKDTGILLKYETYNSAGKVVDYLYPTELEINIPIDSREFVPNLKGYKKEDNSPFKQSPIIMTGNIEKNIPAEIKAQWEQAKKKPDQTTVLHDKGKWYIYPKRGYLVDKIEVKGKEGTLYLVKTSPQKAKYSIPALAEGYKFDKLKVVVD